QPADMRHPDRTVFADAAEVVAQQVYDHYVLGAVLARSQEFVGVAAVLIRRRAARPRPLDGARLNLSLLHAQEAFRRRAGDDKLAKVKVTGERGGVALAETGIQFQRRDRRAVEQALRQI